MWYNWPISIHYLVYIFIMFFWNRILTFYTLRSVRRKIFAYVVKCLLFSKPFSNFVPPKNCSNAGLYYLQDGEHLIPATVWNPNYHYQRIIQYIKGMGGLSLKVT